MTQQVQKRNAQMVDLLRQDFQHRREPNYAWSRAVSMCLALPGLRAFWPMSRVGFTAAQRAMDVGGGLISNDLADFNTPTFGYDSLAPYVEFDGVNQYLARVDGGAANWADITGTEAYIVAAQRGLTIGGWFRFNGAAAANEMLMAKDGAAPNRGYFIRRSAAGTARFGVSGGGAAIVTVNSVTVMVANTWYFIVGRYDPGVQIDIIINTTTTSNAVGIPAALFDNNVSFTVGALAAPSTYLAGRASMCFLCAAQLSNAITLSLYEQTRAIYGV